MSSDIGEEGKQRALPVDGPGTGSGSRAASGTTSRAASRSASRAAPGTTTGAKPGAASGATSGATSELVAQARLAARLKTLSERGGDLSRKALKSSTSPSSRHRLASIGRRLLIGVLGLIAFLLVGFGVAYAFTPIPSAQKTAEAQGSVFYYADGKHSFAKQGTNRQLVPLKNVPVKVRQAVIAAENRSFYDDPGVSVRGTARAFWSTVSGRQIQGGSTITQQMVRNYYSGISQERSVLRKVKEIMVALKVGSEKDKNWILEQYLNTIYFGRDAYGIQAAAKAYYNVDSKDLTTAQGVYLAAAIQQPTSFGNLTAETRPYAVQRWHSVADAMVTTGTLDPAEAARMKFPTPIKQQHRDTLKGQVGYMVNIAKKELQERRGISEDEINRGGLKIITTFDKGLMDAAEKAVTSNVPAGTGKKVRTGLVSVDSATGKVVAFYGGRDYLKEQLSSAFGDVAQPGSGFKPIVLAAALDDGENLGTTVDGSSPQTFNGTAIRNSENVDYGTVNLVTATQNSINTAYVNLGQQIGLDKVTSMAESLGIEPAQLTANQANTSPALPLGVISVHPVQQAGVFATFANQGVYHRPFVVQAVQEPGGRKVKFTENGTRAFSEKVARNATYAMEKVVQSGTGTGAQLYDGRDVAGKTGTTDKGRAIWFNGYIPQMSTTVAMFRSDNKPLSIPGYSIFGGVLPAQIWRTYMTEAVKDIPAKSFPPPSDDAFGDGGYDLNPQPSVPPEPSVDLTPRRRTKTPKVKPPKTTTQPLPTITVPDIKPGKPTKPDKQDPNVSDQSGVSPADDRAQSAGVQDRPTG